MDGSDVFIFPTVSYYVGCHVLDLLQYFRDGDGIDCT